MKPLPAILNVEEAANFLGIKKHDFPILISKKILKPLGSPAKNGPKSFSRVELIEIASDKKKLNKIVLIRQQHWKDKAARKRPA